MSNKFVHLHLHSKASLLDGMMDTETIIEKTKSSGMDSVALTDHANLFNAISFYKDAKKAGIHPVLGVEFNFIEDCAESKITKNRQTAHLILLAQNNKGWNNLIKLVTASNTGDNFYYKPRIDFKLLSQYSEGLILLTGCNGGILSRYLYDRYDENGDLIDVKIPIKAEAVLRKLLSIFDKDHIFIEVQYNQEINDQLRKIGLKYGVRTVATCNVHYASAEDSEAHRILKSIEEFMHVRSSYSDFQESNFFFRSIQDLEGLNFTPEEINLSYDIAHSCKVEIDIKKRRLPKYKFPEGGLKTRPKSSQEILFQLAYEGLEKKNLNNKKDYTERLKKELTEIHEMNFDDYFLIVWDVLNWCRDQKMLLGPGRGSVGGSLVAYCLGITEIDPIKYNLIWERFLNKGRGGLPDIDSDVPRSRRGEVLSYIKERFGVDNVAQLITYGKLGARAVLKDVFRVFNIDFEEANTITNLIPAKNEEHVAISLDEALEMEPKLKPYTEKYKACFAVARKLEGCYKSIGTHASAVVIADIPFSDGEYPLCRASDAESLICAWDMNTIDALSLLKQDVLGLSTLDVISDTFKLVNKDLSLDSIPLDDDKTFDLIRNGRTIGIFQLETPLGRHWSKAASPNNIHEISDVISLIRPATLDNKLTEQYCKVKKGEIPYIPAHPLINDIVKSTCGIMIYQEQAIFAFQKLGGFNLADCDSVRRAIGKKKPEELKIWKEKFIDACTKTIPVEEAQKVWELIETFSGYSFNASHSIAYALLGYYTAYLKANFPSEFICAQLKNAQYAQDTMTEYNKFINDARIFDIQILPPSLKNKNIDFEIISPNKIAFGLSALKGVGEKSLNSLFKTPLNDSNYIIVLLSFIEHKVNRKTIEALIKSGSMDYLDVPRIRMWSTYELFSELTENELNLIKERENCVDFLRKLASEEESTKLKNDGLKIPNSRRRGTLRDLLNTFDGCDPFDGFVEKLGWEKHFLGIPLTGSETDIFKSSHKCRDVIKFGGDEMPVELIIKIDSFRQIKTKKNDDMAFLTGSDNTGQLDNIVVFPKSFNRYKNIINNGIIVKLKGKIDTKGSVIVDTLEQLK